MSYFPDLGCTTMVASGEYVRAVGWLDHTQPFQQGVAPADFVEKLAQFVERAAHSEHVLRLVSLCGYHTCDFCGNAIGANNFGVPSGEVLFIAPVLIRHYVEAHGYLPPAEFIAAVRASPLPGTRAYSLAAAAMFNALQKRPRLGVSVKARECAARSS